MFNRRRRDAWLKESEPDGGSRELWQSVAAPPPGAGPDRRWLWFGTGTVRCGFEGVAGPVLALGRRGEQPCRVSPRAPSSRSLEIPICRCPLLCSRRVAHLPGAASSRRKPEGGCTPRLSPALPQSTSALQGDSLLSGQDRGPGFVDGDSLPTHLGTLSTELSTSPGGVAMGN